MAVYTIRDRTCLVFSGHPWDGLPYGLHHISVELARRFWSVLFLETPFSPFHLAADRRRGRRWASTPRPTHIEGLDIYAPFTLLPYLHSGPLDNKWLLTRWSSFTVPSIARVIAQSGFARPDLFLMGSPLGMPLHRHLRPGQSIYRLADELPLLPSVGTAQIAAERSAITTSDVVIATSQRLEARARELGAQRVISVPNGVDPEHFTRPHPEPPEYSTMARPRLVYIGALERWFDVHAVLELARSRPGYVVVVIGSGGSAGWLETAPKNVIWLGPRPYPQLPAYLQHADVGLVPFRDNSSGQFLSSVNPIKLHEYRAAGLPVVIPTRLGVDSKDPAVLRYCGCADFIKAVDRALGLRALAAEPQPCFQYSWAAILDNLLIELQMADNVNFA